MLIEFLISNYRSICEEQIISFVPASMQKEYSENILANGKYEALNVIALYGANASGKSNLLKAMELLDKLLSSSARANSTSKLPYFPFLLKEGYNSIPTKIEIVFVIEEKRYRFGLEYDRQNVHSEWLYRKSKGREVCLFARKGDIIDVSSGFKGLDKLIDAAIEATRPNSLFLSTCDMLNVEEAKTIFNWFNHYVFVDGLETEKEEFDTVNLWENEVYQIKIKEYLELLDLGFQDIQVHFNREELSATPSITLVDVSIKTMHHIYDKSGKKTNNQQTWSLDENESAGTKKAFHLSGPIIHILFRGGILIIDEIEAKMHPLMTLNTINLFLSKETNPNNAQLIFSTHDTNLLSYSKLRRDQINFVEKNSWEATEMYSLSDFRYFNENQSERPDADKEKRYLEGRYGAIPLLGSFTTKINKWYGKER